MADSEAEMMLRSNIRTLAKFATRLLFVILLSSQVASQAIAAKPGAKDTFSASSADLAQGYLWTKTMLGILPIADAGVTIQLPSESITQRNVETYREMYQKRVVLYGQVIQQRGYRNIAGRYQGRTTPSCGKTQSAWVVLIHEQDYSDIEIQQTGIDATVIVKGIHDGEEWSIRNAAAIAESSISVLDQMNLDYYFQGQMKGSRIVIQPTFSALETWPMWAKPPSRRDLKNCEVTLTPVLE